MTTTNPYDLATPLPAQVESSRETPQKAARRLMAGFLGQGYKPDALHEYTDSEGEPLHWRMRLKHPTLKKEIRPMALLNGRYELKEPPYPGGKPLYNLHKLATDADKTVFIVEGEKCADALNKLGLLATTSGSADSVKSTCWKILAGRDAIIWPDNDAAGLKYADDARTTLQAIGCKVKLVDISKLNLPAKGDCVDWLADFELTHARKAESGDIFDLPMNADRIQAPTSDYLEAGEVEVSTNDVASPAIQPIRTDDDVIAWLASLNPIEYDRARNEQARALKCRPATLDSQVKQLKADNQQDDSPFADIEPWHEPIDPAQLLDDITSTIHRFIVLDKHQAQAAALWVSACWFVDVIQCAPIALINAPEKACGKTQLLSVLGKLAPRPAQASGISPSVLFRMIEAYQPTLFIDEIETILKDNEDLRGLVNAGHTRNSAKVWRSVAKGDDFEPKCFSVWGMKAVAGINAIKLAETITSRSIVIELRRKTSDETIARLRHAEPDLFENLASKLARFSDDYIVTVRDARPHLPDALGDRDQDNWEPLLQVASAAGGHWLETATEAALKLSGASHSTQSTGNELLADIQTIFETKGTLKIGTSELIKALCEDPEAPWATYNRGKELSARQLANRLATYGISSKTIRLGYETAKGFEVEQFDDAFTRYLTDPQNLPSQGNNSLEASNHGLSRVTDIKPASVTCRHSVTNVTDSNLSSVTRNISVTLEAASNKACDGVTDRTHILVGGSAYESAGDDVVWF